MKFPHKIILVIFLLSVPPGNAPAADVAGITPADLAKQTQSMLTNRCGTCHGNQATEPGEFRYIDDLARLRGSEYVNLKDPLNSPLYVEVTQGANGPTMPRPVKADRLAGKKQVVPLSKPETDLLFSWIRAGGPLLDGTTPAGRTPVASNPVAELVKPTTEAGAALADLQSLAKDIQPEIRYVSLAVAVNHTRLTANSRENLRRGARKMLNSLSLAEKVALFPEIGPQKTLLRINLRELGWDASVWERMAAVNPLAVDSTAAQQLATACGASIAILRADWMAATALRPPLYHEILRLPRTQAELETRLGVKVGADLAQGRALRAGFTKSGVSLANRLVEWHELPNASGGYWLSYDFANGEERTSLKQFPLGPLKFPDGSQPLLNGSLAFAHAGGEMVFPLPNGFHAYFVADTEGKRLDGAAPTNVVFDRSDITGRGEISNGLSCIVCHETGLKDGIPPDELRSLAKLFPADAKAKIEQLHPPAGVLQAKLKADIGSFLAALKAAGAEAVTGMPEPIGELAGIYDKEVDVAMAAAEMGLTPEEFLSQIADAPDLGAVSIQFRSQASFQRPEYSRHYAVVVNRLTGLRVKPVAQQDLAATPPKVKPARPVAVLMTLDKAEYHDGESPRVQLEVAEPCHVRVLYQDARGGITMVFPNQFLPSDKVGAGKFLLLPVTNPKVPDEEVSFQINGGKDGTVFGKERFIAVAADQPFSDTAQMLAMAGEEFAKAQGPFTTLPGPNLDAAITKAVEVKVVPRPRVGFSSVNILTKKS